MPSGLIEEKRDVRCLGQRFSEFGEEDVHGRRVRLRQHQGEGLVGGWADGSEDVGRLEALVASTWRALATVKPAMTSASLLSFASFVLAPHLQCLVRMHLG